MPPDIDFDDVKIEKLKDLETVQDFVGGESRPSSQGEEVSSGRRTEGPTS